MSRPRVVRTEAFMPAARRRWWKRSTAAGGGGAKPESGKGLKGMRLILARMPWRSATRRVASAGGAVSAAKRGDAQGVRRGRAGGGEGDGGRNTRHRGRGGG